MNRVILFNNAAETLFLSPIHSEKYMDTAKLVVNFAERDSKARAKIFAARPGPGATPARGGGGPSGQPTGRA